MGKGHVADAQRIEVTQQAQAVFNGVASFNADQSTNSAAFVRCINILSTLSQDEFVWIACNDVGPNGVYHVQRSHGRSSALSILRPNISSEEDGSNASLLESYQICMVL